MLERKLADAVAEIDLLGLAVHGRLTVLYSLAHQDF
jgi:hypothetical protein